MIHIYRDPDALKSKYLEQALPRFLYAGALVLIVFGPFAAGWFPLTPPIAAAAGGFTLLALFGMYNQHRREQYGTCGEIRLDDDGTCELETKRRVIRITASEIQSVEYWRDSDGAREHYTINYRGGKLRVSEQMTGFYEFLTRLKTLNPVVNLTGFPAILTDALPGQDVEATEKHTPVVRFLRSALFPLIVISMIVYLALQTIPHK